MQNIYFPFVYLHKVKRVNQNYIIDSILLNDFPLLIIAFSWLSESPVINALGIFCLMFSFWCIYEFGYYENDLVAEKYEKKPVLSETYYKKLVTIRWWQSWIWSLGIGIVGVSLVITSQSVPISNMSNFSNSYLDIFYSSLNAFFAWFCFLLVSRIYFFIYNYVNKQTRLWLYPLLHCSRYCGFLVVTKTNFVGIGIIISHVLARSTSYMVYRYAGGEPHSWPKLQDLFLRLLFFLIFMGMISTTKSDLSLLVSWQTVAVIILWSKQCRKQMVEIIRNIKPIWDEEAE